MLLLAYMHIIGITGHPSSGKDTIAHHLEGKGFNHISTGDLLRNEMKKHGIPFDRAHMHDFAIHMRQERGAGFLAEEAEKNVTENTIISGLRNTAEVETLKKHFGSKFVLIAVDAPVEVRYVRSKKRKRGGEQISFEQFKKQEEIERHGAPDSQQVDEVIALADFNIKNNTTKKDLLGKVDLLLNHIEQKNITKKVLTLCLLHTDTHVLLGKKKRGFGEGKWNGFGGKVEPGETIEEAALREMKEESGVDILGLKKAGVTQFIFHENPEVLEVHIFRGVEHCGTPVETDEMFPEWFLHTEIPFSDMWPDDRHWMPYFFKEKFFFGKFFFDNENNLKEFDIREQDFL